MLFAALLVLALAPAVGCGGSSSSEELYGDYRSAEDKRTSAESRLREAFADIALASESRNRAAALAAVEEGRAAAEEIESLLEDERDAVGALAEVTNLAVNAKRLERGLEDTQGGPSPLRPGARDRERRSLPRQHRQRRGDRQAGTAGD